MNRITNAALIPACEELLDEGIRYAEMDCQKAVEEAYERAGLEEGDVNLAGSNAHYRACYWTGTPERLCEILGTRTVPAGCEVYIVDNDGGEPAKYRGDDRGNASHMGVYLGDGRTFNSSEKMGGIVASEKFDGRHAVPNGGWNMIGLKAYVDYGFSDDQLEAVGADANDTGDASEAPDNDGPADTTGFYKIKAGSKGGAVKRLQTWLNLLGYALDVDHDFGPKTEEAVEDFQREHGLEEDGIVGRLTWAALAEAKYEQEALG